MGGGGGVCLTLLSQLFPGELFCFDALNETGLVGLLLNVVGAAVLHWPFQILVLLKCEERELVHLF